MKNAHLTYLLFLLLVLGCKKQNEHVHIEDEIKVIKLSNGPDRKYLENPPKNDTMCIHDIEKAKRDIKKYSKVYVKTICFGCRNKPFQKELEEVLKARKTKQVIEDIGCVSYEGQTQGCFSRFIDFEMKRLYGENYFVELENEAEKKFIKNINENDKVVSVYDLNEIEKPKIKTPNIYIKSNYYTTLSVDIPVKIDTGKSLFADITFVIEKNGTITNLRTENWVNDAIDDKYKKELISTALKILKADYNNWNPGKYKGNVARIENTLRINFVNKNCR